TSGAFLRHAGPWAGRTMRLRQQRSEEKCVGMGGALLHLAVQCQGSGSGTKPPPRHGFRRRFGTTVLQASRLAGVFGGSYPSTLLEKPLELLQASCGLTTTTAAKMGRRSLRPGPAGKEPHEPLQNLDRAVRGGE